MYTVCASTQRQRLESKVPSFLVPRCPTVLAASFAGQEWQPEPSWVAAREATCSLQTVVCHRLLLSGELSLQSGQIRAAGAQARESRPGLPRSNWRLAITGTCAANPAPYLPSHSPTRLKRWGLGGAYDCSFALFPARSSRRGCTILEHCRGSGNMVWLHVLFSHYRSVTLIWDPAASFACSAFQGSRCRSIDIAVQSIVYSALGPKCRPNLGGPSP